MEFGATSILQGSFELSRQGSSGSEGPGHSWPALSVVTIVDAVSRQRLTAAPSLSACALISLPR